VVMADVVRCCGKWCFSCILIEMCSVRTCRGEEVCMEVQGCNIRLCVVLWQILSAAEAGHGRCAGSFPVLASI
jgi:hypothetical protein